MKSAKRALQDLSPDSQGPVAEASAGEPLSPGSSPEKVVTAILSGMMHRQFRPGQRLVESELVQLLNVGRSTVREALKRLEAESVVRIVPHRGAHIRVLSRREVHDLLVCLEPLTALAARLAAKNIGTGGKRERFTRAASALVAHDDPDDLFGSIRRRNNFYQAMLAAAENTELPRMLQFLQVVQLRTQFHGFLRADDRKRHFDEYRDITAAVLAGNPSGAERAMKRHVRRSRQRLMKLPDRAFAPDYEE